MSFGQGFVTGLADSLATGLKDDMEKTYDKISQMSALRAKTIVEGSEKHATEFSSFKDGLKSIAAVVNNDMDLVDYLVDQAGGNIDAALAKANEVKNAVANTSGKFSAYDLLGLEQRKNNPSITATQIANRIKGAYVPPPKVSGEMAVGMNQLFRKDISGAINTETDELLSASGITFDKKQDNDVPFIETLSSSGERTKFINAYNEEDSRKRAIKFGHIAENIAVLMGMTDNEAELADLQNQFEIATGEVEIHKTIIKNIDDKYKPPEPFNQASIKSLTKDILGQLNVYSGIEYNVPLKGEGGYAAEGFLPKYKEKQEGRFLIDKANQIVNQLSNINSYYTGSGKNIKTYTDADPNVVQNTKNKIMSLISKGIDYRIVESQDSMGNPIVEVLPVRLDGDTTAYDNMMEEVRQISEDTDAVSTIGIMSDLEAASDAITSPFKPFFTPSMFTTIKGKSIAVQPPPVPLPNNVKQFIDDFNADLGINIFNDIGTGNTGDGTGIDKILEMEYLQSRYKEFLDEIGSQGVVGVPSPNDWFDWYEMNYPDSAKILEKIDILSAAQGTDKQVQDSSGSIFANLPIVGGFFKQDDDTIKANTFMSNLKKNKGAEYNLTGQTFDNIKVNKVMVTNAGTIELEITEENGSTTKIGSLHPKYTKLVEAGFDLQKAVESAK
jgi:hypothetical protein